ncbi:MAG: hypothetical protein U0892_04320 [Pirellulales bacterium]
MSMNGQLSTYHLLPTVFRLRDGQNGGSLEALLQVIDEQVRNVADNVRDMYGDFFIETCRPEFVPYIGELVGRPVVPTLINSETAAEFPNAMRLVNPRREVSDAISLHRRKGTLPVLEELAKIVAGWPAHAEEWYPRVAQFQNQRDLFRLHDQELHSATRAQAQSLTKTLTTFGESVDTRKLKRNGSLDGPFDQGAFFTDTKQEVNDCPAPKNRDLLRLHVWRLKTYRATQSRAMCIRDITIACGESRIQLYTFDSVGLCKPLFVNPQPEAHDTDLSSKSNLPIPLTRDLLTAEPKTENPIPTPPPFHQPVNDLYYGRGKSVEVWVEECNVQTKLYERRFLPSSQVHVCDLSMLLCDCDGGSCDCGTNDRLASIYTQLNLDPLDGDEHPSFKQNKCSSTSGTSEPQVLVDPECGLLAIRISQSTAAMTVPELLTTYTYAFSADIGGGEYRRDREPQGRPHDEFIRLRRDIPEQSRSGMSDDQKCDSREYLPLKYFEFAPTTAKGRPFHKVVEIADSDTYRIRHKTIIKVPAGNTLEIRAANFRCPTIEIDCNECDGSLEFHLQEGAKVILDGLRIAGSRITFAPLPSDPIKLGGCPNDCQSQEQSCPQYPVDPQRRIVIRHCTLVPGGKGCAKCCKSIRPAELECKVPNAVIKIDHSVVATTWLNIPEDSQASHSDKRLKPSQKVQRLWIRDSIVDGQHRDNVAICGTGTAIARIERSTLLGTTSVREFDLAQDSVFSKPVTANRTQPGGMRFCFVPANSGMSATAPIWHTPQQFYCVPSQSYERKNLVDANCGCPNQPPKADDSWRRITLSFTSCRYGDPAYCQLQTMHAEKCAASTSDCGCHDHDAGPPECKCKGKCGGNKDDACGCRSDAPCNTDQLCSKEISRGAECGSEMGAFHSLYQPQREDNLRQRLNEFTPHPMRSELRFMN